MDVKTIADLGDIRGRRILLRLDFNVSLVDGVVRDAFRIESVLPTIDELSSSGAKVGIISHIENDGGATLLPVFEYLSRRWPVSFSKTLPELTADLLTAKNGDVFLMENIRQYEGEKGNDTAFAREMSAAADLYVNDAFSVSHREHASIVGVPKFLPAAAGPLFLREIEGLSKAFSPPKPFFMILSGAKFETKLPLIRRFLTTADAIFVGGAIANDLLKARGKPVGASKVSKKELDLSDVISAKHVLVPLDVTVETKDGHDMKAVESIEADDVISDIGPQTAKMIEKEIARAACIMWNGPLGVFERGFNDGTERTARAISQSKAHSIVGGGDTIAAIRGTGALEKISFVSTGGGAMLDFLAEGTLPGIEVLKK